MIGDGLFHIFDGLMTAIGIFLLWRAANSKDVPMSSKPFIGSLLIGMGSFNAIEGILDRQILGIHPVKTGANELAWDIGFIAVGLLIAGLGWLLVRTSQSDKTLA